MSDQPLYSMFKCANPTMLNY